MKLRDKTAIKRFVAYLIRWQLSSPILALCLWLLGNLDIIVSTVIANLIGGCVFYFVDKRIFRGDQGEG